MPLLPNLPMRNKMAPNSLLMVTGMRWYWMKISRPNWEHNETGSRRKGHGRTWTWTWTWKMFIRQKQIPTRNNVINDTYRMFYVGRPLQRRWAQRWRKSHPDILQCMNRHRSHEVLTFWEHKFGICNQKERTPLDKAPSRHTRAHNWHSYNEEKNKTVVSKGSFVIAK